MTKLRLASDLSLPLEAATEKLAFLGRTGTGKTYAAQKLAEELHRAGAQFVALDPVGKWWSLRLAADGKGAGIPIPVFGGLHGDVPLEPGGGKLLADVVCDRGVSAVLDVSQFESDAQKNRFARDFGERFFFRKKAAPSAVHLFLEECQEFVPQNLVGDDDRKVLHAFTRIWKLGRNFGIGGSLISQRPQEVSKKVLNLTEVLFAFQLNGTHERKAVAQWIEDKALDVDVDAILPKLQQGEPHVWSPVLLDISRTVNIGKKWTFDASATPKVGERATEVRPLAPIDLERIRKDMAATIEKAKAEDPKELRRRIAELERAQRSGKAVPAPPPRVVEKEIQKRVEIPVLKDGQVKRLESACTKLVQVGDSLVVVGKEITAALARVGSGNGHKAPQATRPTYRQILHPVARPAPVRQVQRSTAPGDARPLRKGALRMLEAVARRYPAPTTEAQVAQLAGLARTGGTFSTYLSDLRKGYIVEHGDQVELTDAGWEAIGQTPGALAPQSTEEVLSLYAGVLRGGARRMIQVLVDAYPKAMSRADLAVEAIVTETGGTFSTYLSDLRKAGLVEEEGQDVRASETLMDPAGAGG